MHSSTVTNTVNDKSFSERKASRLIGFHLVKGKTFVVFASSVLKVMPLLKVFEGKLTRFIENP